MHKLRMTSAQRDVHTAISLQDGCTYAELAQLVDKSPAAVAQTVRTLCDRGLVRIERDTVPPTSGKRKAVSVIRCHAIDPAEAARKQSEAAAKAGSLNDQLRELEELRAFKAMAIKRYPDLVVPEITFRARKIVARTFEQQNDMLKAQEFIAGRHDHTPIMLATIAALEGD